MTDGNLTFTMNKCMCMKLKEREIICNCGGKGKCKCGVKLHFCFVLKTKRSDWVVRDWQTPDMRLGPGPSEPFNYASFNKWCYEQTENSTRSITMAFLSSMTKAIPYVTDVCTFLARFTISTTTFSKYINNFFSFQPSFQPKILYLIWENSCN